MSPARIHRPRVSAGDIDSEEFEEAQSGAVSAPAVNVGSGGPAMFRASMRSLVIGFDAKPFDIVVHSDGNTFFQGLSRMLKAKRNNFAVPEINQNGFTPFRWHRKSLSNGVG
jgi:hypothetical protein